MQRFLDEKTLEIFNKKLNEYNYTKDKDFVYCKYVSDIYFIYMCLKFVLKSNIRLSNYGLFKALEFPTNPVHSRSFIICFAVLQDNCGFGFVHHERLHVTCPECKRDFCWKCKETVSYIPTKLLSIHNCFR